MFCKCSFLVSSLDYLISNDHLSSANVGNIKYRIQVSCLQCMCFAFEPNLQPMNSVSEEILNMFFFFFCADQIGKVVNICKCRS